MKLRETIFPYVIQDIDYVTLGQLIEQAFEEEYGSESVRDVRVAHFNPNVISVSHNVTNYSTLPRRVVIKSAASWSI